MTPQEEKEFVEQAFGKLMERGWFPGQKLERSTIIGQEIAAFEQAHKVILPSLYKAYLTSYRFPRNDFHSICSIIEKNEELRPLWLIIDSPWTMDDISERMEILQEIREFCELPEDCFRNLIPIGDWGAGWGPLCIDLSRPEDQVDEKRKETWSLIWFDHEEFEWDEYYLGEDRLLHGHEALPDLKTLLEWYFYGTLEDRFEQEEGIRPGYQWYHDLLKR